MLRIIILVIETPWLRNLLLVLFAIATVIWICDQVKKQKEGDELRDADRRHGDSVWDKDNW